jgi:general secretion pathway protein J
MMRRLASWRNAARLNERGFTLVELLVSLALLVVMLALINGALRFGRRAWEVSGEVERSQNLAAFRSLLAQRLTETLPSLGWDDRGLPQPTFHGASDQLTFLTTMPSRDGMPAGLFSATLRLLPPSGAASWPLTLEFRAVVGPNAPQPTAGHAPVLLDNVAQLAIRYYGLPERGGEPGWRDEWQGQTTVPRLVTVDVQFSPGDPRIWAPLTAELKLGARAQSGR